MEHIDLNTICIDLSVVALEDQGAAAGDLVAWSRSGHHGSRTWCFVGIGEVGDLSAWLAILKAGRVIVVTSRMHDIGPARMNASDSAGCSSVQGRCRAV